MRYLYYNMSCRVTIGNVMIDYVNSISITESIKKLADVATVVIPREYLAASIGGKTEKFANQNILKFIKVNDPVIIKLGYDGKLETEFTGYVSKVSADIPLVIECEDEMFQLRKSNFSKTFRSVSLLQLLKTIAPNYKYDVIDDIKLGKFTINNASAYRTLETLRKDYGLHSRFVGKILQVGFPISLIPQAVHEININRNVRAQSNDLKFVRKEDFKILLKAISINKNGARLTSDFGDKDGAQRTLHFTNKTLSELKLLAEKNYKSLNFDGYQGSIPTWGLPRTKAGESVDITDPNYKNSERNGKYLIEEVIKKFNSTDGFKRINKLSLKL
ncbi:MAG: hypothetical protein V3V28_08640 [Polaribacter sp.]|uniref:hypothetical protein n=1 Tax=Polaribacter sp. TaxID=1920175 RepID=UPI002F357FFA